MVLAVQYHLEESTAPTFAAVSVADVKERLRIEGFNDDDSLIADYIEEATNTFQEELSLQFATATYKLHMDGFSSMFELPRPPVTSVSSITYLDSAGDEQTVSTSVYRTVLTGPVPYVELAYNQTWPTTRGISRDVTVTFVCGYANGSVPVRIQGLIAMYVKKMLHGDCGEQNAIDSMKAGLRWRIV